MNDAALPWKTAIIVAFDKQGGFSKDGKIPWHFLEDFKWFQRCTHDSICVMGRKTYDGIMEYRMAQDPDAAVTTLLPSRTCFVLTSTPLPHANACAIQSIQELRRYWSSVNQEQTVFFIGGQQLFEETVGQVNECFLTMIDDTYDCDRFFPLEHLQQFSPVGYQRATTFNGGFVHTIRRY